MEEFDGRDFGEFSITKDNDGYITATSKKTWKIEAHGDSMEKVNESVLYFEKEYRWEGDYGISIVPDKSE